MSEMTPEATSAMQNAYFKWLQTLIPSLKKPTVQDAWAAAFDAGREYERSAGQAAEIERLRTALEQCAAFWRPIARDLEHDILSIESLRFVAQDFLTELHATLAATRAPEPSTGERPADGA